MDRLDINIINKKNTSLHFEFIKNGEKEEAALTSIEGLAHFGLGRKESDTIAVDGAGENTFPVITKKEGPLKGYSYGMVVGIYFYKDNENRNKDANFTYKDVLFTDMLDLDEIKIYYNITNYNLNVVIFREEQCLYSSI
ncbi:MULTISPECIES: hypothetical protein [Clostridium]|uniref:Uncharacterized protein n=1 Tax=Clostridium senegalense TaxID=1465809 RepID=A0A6M0H388_9CLOT|nr:MULTISPECIES: hypothetical protein [Clostridium]NEU04092.1 hypothetical protein [Clostridium senegalense]